MYISGKRNQLLNHKEMSNFITTSLPAYVQENKDLLIKNFALAGGETRKRISVQTGIKKDEHINYLNLTPTFQSGTGCGFNAQGDAALTQRLIETARFKVNMDVCPDTLVGKYAEYQVSINASENASLPFEAYIMEALNNEIVKKIETSIWQGVKATDLIDGFLTIAAADSAVVDVTLAGTSVYTDILAVYAAMSENTLEQGGEIYVSPAKFRSFMQEMVSSNYYHYNPGNAEPGEFLLPGSDVKVVRTPGLAGKTEIVGTFPKNMYYGCDLENAAEDIKVWYSDDNDLIKIAAKWNMGVQFAFPGEVVLGA